MTRWLACSLVVAWTSPVCAQAALVNAADRTYLVEDGRVIGARDGTFVATSRGLVELRVDSVDVPLEGCPPGDDSDEDLVGAADRDHGGGVRVVAIAEDGASTVVFDDAPEVGPRDYDAGIETLSVLGTYVLGTAFYSSSNCMGAHPDDGGRRFIGYDLETGSALELAHDPRVARWAARQRARVLTVFSGVDMFDQRVSPPEVAALVPVFDRLGRVALDAIYILFTCYACSDVDDGTVGDWARYYSAAHVPSRLPVFLRDAITPTAAARTAVAATGARVSGAGMIDASIALRVRSAFATSTE
jgi:hypothetical protein